MTRRDKRKYSEVRQDGEGGEGGDEMDPTMLALEKEHEGEGRGSALSVWAGFASGICC